MTGSAVIAALEQVGHLSRGDGAGVGASAGVAYGQLGYRGQLLEELLLVDAELLQGLGDVQAHIVGVDLFAQRLDQLGHRPQ